MPCLLAEVIDQGRPLLQSLVVRVDTESKLCIALCVLMCTKDFGGRGQWLQF